MLMVTMQSVGMTRQSVGFTGKERDAETGLDYFIARYYGGAQGRFTSPDPFSAVIDSEDRDEFEAYLANPQSWNKVSATRTPS